MEWLIRKVYHLFTQHYFLAPLALIGLISIYFFIIKLYRNNKALDLRLKRFEAQLKKEDE
jgi:hypothetical protein